MIRTNVRFFLGAVATLLLLAGPAAAIAPDTASYTYYANGRLHTVTYANGTVITYVYDPAGNRTSVTIACGSGGC